MCVWNDETLESSPISRTESPTSKLIKPLPKKSEGLAKKKVDRMKLLLKQKKGYEKSVEMITQLRKKTKLDL